ncbi:hypothetical protein Glove_406g90 [Diversispora epigaea]|uniref:Uncharacterized protein n=1 Tax=Diversispora epigaea TaxID=1348612 RepID=A0A397H3Y7_9GLOM|nr:hypothetical protein Glove_406g90 [Diversispora epigaea]
MVNSMGLFFANYLINFKPPQSIFYFFSHVTIFKKIVLKMKKNNSENEVNNKRGHGYSRGRSHSCDHGRGRDHQNETQDSIQLLSSLFSTC